MNCLDSDEEEAMQNEALLKMMTMPHAKTKKERHVEDFEAEMEMELNRRAQVVETEGGVEHQKSLSRSSSTSSLNAQTVASSPQPGSSKPKSSLKSGYSESEKGSPSKRKKSVRFTDSASHGSKQGENSPSAMYDDIYFDSDESDGGDGEKAEDKAKKKSNRKLLTNDDLFYDPMSDGKDQVWMDKRRANYFSKHAKKQEDTTEASGDKEKNADTLPNSDAVLNCPACFTTLCVDCQRHDFYQGQYRAMFVVNCVVDRTESRYVPAKSDKYKSRKRKHDQNLPISNGEFSAPFQADTSDTFNPVKCKVCNTEVAVYDSEDVYHFFNILTSHT